MLRRNARTGGYIDLLRMSARLMAFKCEKRLPKNFWYTPFSDSSHQLVQLRKLPCLQIDCRMQGQELTGPIET